MHLYLNEVDLGKENVFSDISNLKQALDILKKFYESKTEMDKLEYSSLLLRLSHQIVVKYEAEPGWFMGDEEEISILLNRLSNQVFALHKEEDIYSKNIIDNIKVLVYKFSRYCKDDQRGNVGRITEH
ncbi:MAG: hypothetical protein Q4C69_13410 [Lachnoclostridium edouardi]|uniref:hypothetical protein n=1 Tax=Lachnoclostridium edouardi TaxID=1926283 RepID=UPI0026DAF3A2|nr:hypothetical protein [Lachnoclostridium edouardi]MDO4279819.1 hypothetical protein [Lachnoclostridium edouardi]